MIRVIRAWGTSSIVVLVLVGAVGCTPEDESSEVAPAEPPSNVCELVPASVVSGWDLQESDHEAVLSESKNSATCTMTGPSTGSPGDSPVDLEIDLVFFGGTDRDSARAAAQEETVRRCASVPAQEDPLSSDSGCRSERPAEAFAVETVPLADAVVTVRMSSDSERGVAALAADTEAVVGALISLER